MATSKIIYIKSKVQGYYGLAGFRYEYDKLMVTGEPLVSGSTICTDNGVFKHNRAVSCGLITKQEYQKATGNYACDIDESKPVQTPCREVKGTLPTPVFFGAIVAAIVSLVISLCAN